MSNLKPQELSLIDGKEWLSVFANLAHNESYKHLHQLAGWTDIDDIDVWLAYVKDVVAGYVFPGCSVFEAGCGCLAFLLAVKEYVPSISLHGIDATPDFITMVQQLAPAYVNNFHTGVLPHALSQFADNSFDVVVSNSVAAYLPSHDDVQSMILHMLRMVRSGGTVIVADVCDEASKQENEQKMEAHWRESHSNLRYGIDLPRYLYFDKTWFKQFDVRSIEIRHSNVEAYWRRTDRYIVYLTKP